MASLSLGYQKVQAECGEQPLLLLSDIDGTILDMRHMICGVLQSYDRLHETSFFERLRPEDIDVHENEVEVLLTALKIPAASQTEILDHFREQRWSEKVITEGHQPFQGVLEMIRWFQLQPNTDVGLVTGRPESVRDSTLRSLNILGKLHRVEFSSDMLYMSTTGWGKGQVKVAGLRHFRDRGYFVFAFVDNEPENLKDLAKEESAPLLLHANTIFETGRGRLPRGTVRGNEYRVDELIRSPKILPRGVQMVWHGVNDEANLRQFLASNVQWAEVDARLAPSQDKVVLRHDSVERNPITDDEELSTLRSVLEAIKQHDRAVKLDMKGGMALLEMTLRLVDRLEFADDKLWFNSSIQDLRKEGFETLARERPGTIIQCPVDFLAPLIVAAPNKAHDVLEEFRNWGINRFSVSWQHDDRDGTDKRELFDRLELWGYDVNLYGVSDLESFLHAVLLLPRSVTADYNFPKWQFYGRGAGQDGATVEYKMDKKSKNRK